MAGNCYLLRLKSASVIEHLQAVEPAKSHLRRNVFGCELTYNIFFHLFLCHYTDLVASLNLLKHIVLAWIVASPGEVNSKTNRKRVQNL